VLWDVTGADNQAAIRALENIKGTPGQHLVDLLHEKIEEIHGIHGHEALEIWWTPSHEGIKENERADEEAKNVARGDTSPDEQLPLGCKGRLKMSRSVARQYHSKKFKLDAIKQFAKSPRFPHLHNINLLTPSSRFH